MYFSFKFTAKKETMRAILLPWRFVLFLGIERFMLSFTNCIVMSGPDALPCHAMQSIDIG